MYPGYASSLAQPYCHHGRRTGAADIDEGVPDLAPARARIWLVMTCAEVGDPDLVYIVVDRCRGRGTKSGSG